MAISSNGLAGLKPGVVDNAAARPSSPFEGQAIYQKDTDEVLYYNGTSWGKAWNMARGVMGYVVNTSSNLSITATEADFSGMSITFTAETGRLYQVSFNCFYLQADASSRFIVGFVDSANTYYASTQQVNPVATGYNTFSYSYIFGVATSGSITRKVRGQTTGGNVTLFGSSTSPISYVIQDIGPT